MPHSVFLLTALWQDLPERTELEMCFGYIRNMADNNKTIDGEYSSESIGKHLCNFQGIKKKKKFYVRLLDNQIGIFGTTLSILILL